MNLPFSHRYIIRLHVNGVTDNARNAVFEAVMQPDRSFAKEWMPDSSAGDFFKVDRAFEFNDGGGLVADPEPRLQPYSRQAVSRSGKSTGGTGISGRPIWSIITAIFLHWLTR